MVPGKVPGPRPSAPTPSSVLADHPDPRRAELRAAVTQVDALLGRATVDGALTDAWARLVKLLALGPAPALRTCPACGHLGMADATRCGHCWTALTPPAHGAVH